MGRHAQDSAAPRRPEAVSHRSAPDARRHESVRPRGAARGRAEVSSRGTEHAARRDLHPVATSGVGAVATDAPVAMSVLPPVPTTGSGRAITPAAAQADSAEPRVVARPRRQRRRPGQTRRGGRMHGALVYVTGALLVLSSVYGV